MFRKIIFFSVFVFLISCNSYIAGPQASEEFYNLGNIFFEKGEFEKARESYLSSLRFSRNNAKARFNLALCYMEMDDIESARSELEILYKKDKSNTRVIDAIAYTYASEGLYEEGMKWWKLSLEIFEGDREALVNSSLYRMSNGQWPEAESLLRKLNQYHPGSYSRMLLAKCLKGQNKTEELIRLYEIQYSSDDQTLETILDMADYFGLNQDYEKEGLLWKKALELDPENPEYSFALAKVSLLYLYDYFTGIEALENSLEWGFSDSEEVDNLLQKLSPDIRDPIKLKFSL